MLLAISLVCTPLVVGQQRSNDWNSVQAISAGAKLLIKLRDGKSSEGKFTSATDTSVQIERKGKVETLTRDSIFQIYEVKRKAEKGKFALIGAGIGAGTGLGIGATKVSRDKDDSELYPKVGAMLGAGIGAVGGLLFGSARRKRILIYEMK